MLDKIDGVPALGSVLIATEGPARPATGPHESGPGEASAGLFARDGYVAAPGFLAPDEAAEMSAALKRMVAEGMTDHDDQVPNSDSVHGAPAIDALLEAMLPKMQELTGKTLLPTYAYARIYRPGAVLEKHTDRAACEISVTLCVGYDGAPWPIFISDGQPGSERNVARLTMNPGDALIYRGCEKMHWRDAYTEGQWQAQIFLHFVDAQGPWRDEKYDRRKRLGHHEEPDGLCRLISGALSREACAGLVRHFEAMAGEQAGIGGGQGATTIDTSVRDVTRFSVSSAAGIGATLAGIGLDANANFYAFDIRGSNQSEALRYLAPAEGEAKPGGHYNGHIDVFISPGSRAPTRKLTVLALLNDDFEGGRFFISDGDHRKYPLGKAGDVLVFPSFLVHGVEPVTKGTRWSVVGWLVGPWFK